MTSDSLFIATPSYRPEVQVAYLYSMLRTADVLLRAGTRWTTQVFAGAPVPQARNILTAKFMASEYSHMLCIDADVSWKASDVARLLSASQYHEVCCGVYPKKTKDLQFPANFIHEGGGPVEHPATGFWELKDACAGFLMICRSAIERMIAASPERKCVFGHDHPEAQKRWEYNLFDCFIDADGTFLSEDFGFSRLYQRAGGRIWADPEARLVHHGYAEYSGGITDIAVST